MVKDLSSFRNTLSGFLSWQPQTVTTFQPSLRSWRVCFRPLAMLQANFLFQKALLLFGVVASLQPLCRCREQPQTTTSSGGGRKLRELLGERFEVEIHQLGLAVFRFFRERDKAAPRIKINRIFVGVGGNKTAACFVPSDKQNFDVIQQLCAKPLFLERSSDSKASEFYGRITFITPFPVRQKPLQFAELGFRRELLNSDPVVQYTEIRNNRISVSDQIGNSQKVILMRKGVFEQELIQVGIAAVEICGNTRQAFDFTVF
ncbi:MAG TPA: hypothetical protein PKI68_04440 [Pontiellaceae bacterium]|nr:hypothetical protein [Pontiellaceae bacterium]